MLVSLCAIALGAQTTWFPVYIVNIETFRVNVVAPSASAAKALVQQDLCFPGIRTNPIYKWRTDQVNKPDPTELPPRPWVSPEDALSFQNDVWVVLGAPPSNRSSTFKTPTLADWQAKTANMTTAQDPYLYEGMVFTPSTLVVNRDNPAYAQSWRLYTEYIIDIAPYVWYYQAATLADAMKQANLDWISGGRYALGRPITKAEVEAYLADSTTLNIPARAWTTLMSLNCEHQPDPNAPEFGAWEYVSDSPHPFNPPYNIWSQEDWPVPNVYETPKQLQARRYVGPR